jgi:2-polyprenyl-3-methyl-5-hydroxy-6-metoxy-1,4-benzoquinol methylase
MGHYGSITVKSPNALRRWSHRSRFDAVARLIDASPGDRILDFGTGDGFFLDLLHRQQPRAEYFGFEPLHFMEDAKALNLEGVRLESDFDRLPLGYFNKIACLEVMEHLPSAPLQTAIGRIVAAAAPGAHIVISVPIENGLPSLVKNIVRAATARKSHGKFDARNMWLALAGMGGSCNSQAIMTFTRSAR